MTANRTNARSAKKISSEVLFLEQCIRYLRPGGLLTIVVPRSVITNDSLADARRIIDSSIKVEAVLNLPPETFALTGTQARAITGAPTSNVITSQDVTNALNTIDPTSKDWLSNFKESLNDRDWLGWYSFNNNVGGCICCSTWCRGRPLL